MVSHISLSAGRRRHNQHEEPRAEEHGKQPGEELQRNAPVGYDPRRLLVFSHERLRDRKGIRCVLIAWLHRRASYPSAMVLMPVFVKNTPRLQTLHTAAWS